MSRLRRNFAARHPAAQLARGVHAAGQDLRSGARRCGRSGPGELSGGEPRHRRHSVARGRNAGGGAALASRWRRERGVPGRPDGHDFIGFDEDLSIRRELDRFLRAQGVAVNLAMHFDNIQTIKEAVALGSGISILPARTMQAEIAQGRLVAVRCTRRSCTGRWASCTGGGRSSTRDAGVPGFAQLW